jgi:hypothetical protein
MVDRPVDRSDTYVYDDVLAMTQRARNNGINGFVVSWSGQRDAAPFTHVINAAEATGGVVTGYLETLNTNATSDPSKPARRYRLARIRQGLGRRSTRAKRRALRGNVAGRAGQRSGLDRRDVVERMARRNIRPAR